MNDSVSRLLNLLEEGFAQGLSLSYNPVCVHRMYEFIQPLVK